MAGVRSDANRAERNARGSAADRRARRDWIVSPLAGMFADGLFIPFGGDGEKVPCVHCGRVLRKADVEIDRIIPGGPYKRANIQPACMPCNRSRSNNVEWTYDAAVDGRC